MSDRRALVLQWRDQAPATWQLRDVRAALGVTDHGARRLLEQGKKLGYWHQIGHTWRPGPLPEGTPTGLRPQRVLDYLARHPGSTAREIATALDLPGSVFWTLAATMQKAGTLTATRGGKCRVYYAAGSRVADGRGQHRAKPHDQTVRGLVAQRHRLEEAEVRYLQARGLVETADLAAAMGTNPRQVRRILARLADAPPVEVQADDPPPEPEPELPPLVCPRWRTPAQRLLRALVEEPWSTLDETGVAIDPEDVEALVRAGVVRRGTGGALAVTDAGRGLA
jgi:hypothetical protein